MSFLAALRFLTIMPLPSRRWASPEEVGRSTSYFPVVGILVGLILAGINWLFGLVLPPALVNALLLVSLVVVSGALHLDGFIDTCDGIAGHRTVEERWRVMHDSRVGAFGIIGAVLLLLVKYASLNSLPAWLLPATLVLMPVVSRWAMVYAIFAYPYARPTGLGKVFKQETRGPSFAIATIITVTAAIGLMWWADLACFYLGGLALLTGVWAMVVVVAAYLSRKLAGLTGDTYGAINEVAEAGVLILVSLLAHSRLCLT